jgi:hypothetical protein
MGVLVVLIAILLTCWWIKRNMNRSLNVEGYSQIRVGMTRPEVERILGGPPGNYGRYESWKMSDDNFTKPSSSIEEIWRDDSNYLEVYFDREGQVIAWHRPAYYTQFASPSWLDQLMIRLGL